MTHPHQESLTTGIDATRRVRDWCGYLTRIQRYTAHEHCIYETALVKVPSKIAYATRFGSAFFTVARSRVPLSVSGEQAIDDD
jgi:hypothetical protein